MKQSKEQQDQETCDPACERDRNAGPTREGGGTTGAGNLSPGGASRTGGATSGVRSPGEPAPPSADLPPDA